MRRIRKFLGSHWRSTKGFFSFIRNHPKHAFRSIDWIENFPDWYRSLDPYQARPLPQAAWVPYRAQEWLKKNIHSEMRVFEFGSGGSTLFFSRHAGHVYSIEHDPEWAEKVRTELRLLNRSNWELDVRPPIEISGNIPTYSTTSFTSTFRPEVNARLSFQDYVCSIEQFQQLDFVFIDGRARMSCIAEALPRVRPGGYIFLDNSERESYRIGFELLKDFPREDFWGIGPASPFPWMSSVWQIRS